MNLTPRQQQHIKKLYEDIRTEIHQIRYCHKLTGESITDMYAMIDNWFKDLGLSLPDKDYDYIGMKTTTHLPKDYSKPEHLAETGALCPTCGGPLSPPEACVCGPECHKDYLRGRGDAASHQLKAGPPIRRTCTHNKLDHERGDERSESEFEEDNQLDIN